MVDNIIFYFTGTGNSYDAANRIAAGLDHTKLIAMSDNWDMLRVQCQKRIGFVFPAYYGGMPLIVQRFMRRIKLPDDIYTFVVVTYTNSVGNALHQVLSILTEREYHLSYGTCIPMTGSNMIHMGQRGKIEDKLQNSYKRLDLAIEEIGNYELYNRFINRPIHELVYRHFKKKCNKLDYHFRVEDSCNRCGLCAKVCQVKNIDLVDGRPIFHHHCEHCLACVQFCPSHAIQYKKKTVGKEQYHNPTITAKELIEHRI